jgi:hypothetical protein
MPRPINISTAEERDTIRRLRALTETLKSRQTQSGDPGRVAA